MQKPASKQPKPLLKEIPGIFKEVDDDEDEVGDDEKDQIELDLPKKKRRWGKNFLQRFRLRHLAPFDWKFL